MPETSVAALYDVHGNLPALEAALATVDGAEIESIVVGGDLVLGPMPVETLERLLALGPRARFIRGNCDRLVVDAFDDKPPSRLPASVQESIVWVAGQLDQAQRDFLASLPERLTIEVAGIGDVLFCHATPRSDEELFTAITPVERVRPMLGGVTQPVVVCGHTHMQFDRMIDGIRVINVGSVGMPFGRPGAHWMRLGPGLQLIRTEFDLKRAAALIAGMPYPQASEFATRHVLSPPSEQEMLGAFEALVGSSPSR